MEINIKKQLYNQIKFFKFEHLAYCDMAFAY